LRADDPARDAGLLHEHVAPYAAAMTTLVDEGLATTGRAIVPDVHSYPTAPLPYELHGAGPRPPVCLRTDAFHTSPELPAAARAVFRDTGVDSPFAGCHIPPRHDTGIPRCSA